MSDDTKRKRSWREIDSMRDKSAHRRVERPGTEPSRRRGNKSYKSELDQLFDKGVASSRIQSVMKEMGQTTGAEEQNPEKTKLVRQIRQADTFDQFVGAVNELRKEHSLPNDANILTRVLEHPDIDVVCDALERLADMVGRLKLTDIKAISARLDTLESISDDPQVENLIGTLRKKM